MVVLSALLKKEGFDVVVYSNKQHKVVRLFHMCFGVLKHLKADYILIDTYSTTNFYYALIVSQLARLLSIKYLPILHGGNLPYRLHKNPKLCKLIFENSKINVAPSRYLLQEFQQKNFKTSYIPNTIELKGYSFKKRTMVGPKLLWVRAFDEIYNPAMAIKVLLEVLRTHPNARLCMVGSDKNGYLNSMKSLAKQFNVLEHILFTGILPKEQWHQLSEGYDIFINTSNIDNTPVSVIEAMTLGLPVISTNVGGMPYLITHGVDGILVEKDDYKAMAHEIIKLIKENNLILVENARKKVKNFEWSVVREKWIAILS